jgi:hypothetical protein
MQDQDQTTAAEQMAIKVTMQIDEVALAKKISEEISQEIRRAIEPWKRQMSELIDAMQKRIEAGQVR